MKKFPFEKSNQSQTPHFDEVLQQLKESKDFTCFTVGIKHDTLCISYFNTLIDTNILHRDLLPYLNKSSSTLYDAVQALPIENLLFTQKPADVQNHLLIGYISITVEGNNDQAVLVKADSQLSRTVSLPEVEFSVIGPKESLVESLDTNLHLIRKRLPIQELKVEVLTVGKLSKSRVALLHIDGICNQKNVSTVIQRISNLDVKQIIDSSYIAQMIADKKNSPFPQFIDTERPDRLAAVLGEGKLVILVDGAPHGLLGPATLVEFFTASEDYFINWTMASFFRLVRFFAVLFSILITPIYVAILTYHYELLPKNLINTLVISRSGIPFPPILEALVLELVIELLREAGARLPTKVGQTIGIVGGIVIGTASVEAGLTSNVLLIIVALSALASFTTPVYQMGNTIRLIRFPFLFMAYYIGILGVAISFCFMLIHLLRITTLGRPYLEPLYPPKLESLKDSLIRLPLTYLSKRPASKHEE
ncbi:spore germination protein [Peribacillus huizhouensis]|uniref:Spore germination protein n=1 Tax=Peribacillus huizhouensis TaxID=1501239 RepID=A0ABR6CMH5_9BACI|nr:spore germination protein [Peribacillus huizhouensis]MBA9026215.1 hypothetical protein [Peribacillus huizhouensis]